MAKKREWNSRYVALLIAACAMPSLQPSTSEPRNHVDGVYLLRKASHCVPTWRTSSSLLTLAYDGIL